MSKSLISEHHAACTEHQAKALLAAARELLAVVSESGAFLYVGEGFSRVLGFAPEELLGKPVGALPAPSDAPRFRESFAELVKDGRETAGGRFSLRGRSGQYRWFEVSLLNRLADPEVGGVVMCCADITEVQRMEAQRLVLSNIVHALNQTSNLDELLFRIHDALKKVVYADNFFVALYDPQTEMFHFPFFVDQFDPPPPPQKVASTCMAYVFRTGNACSIPQSEFDRLAAAGEVELVGSASPAWLGVPLKTPSATIGVMV